VGAGAQESGHAGFRHGDREFGLHQGAYRNGLQQQGGRVQDRRLTYYELLF